MGAVRGFRWGGYSKNNRKRTKGRRTQYAPAPMLQTDHHGKPLKHANGRLVYGSHPTITRKLSHKPF